MILVTGGAGFIGSNFVNTWLHQTQEPLVNLDKLTYAGNLGNFVSIRDSTKHNFIKGDISDAPFVATLLSTYRPRAVIHFAAESHVDRSIAGPDEFISTNIVGTFRLLESVRGYWSALSGPEKSAFRFLHVSTDEVFGSLDISDAKFSESTPYAPNSPYSASKASSDHLVRAYFHTYGVPTLTTNCSNNYGPFQFPEKLIPLMIHNGIVGKPLPVYGDGLNVRDWLYVEDHCAALRGVLENGRVGENYNVGGNNEIKNISVVKEICSVLDKLQPRADGISYQSQISFVQDRPGHDRRYAIDTTKIEREIGWRPSETFETGLQKTIQWYLDNGSWVADIVSGDYQKWIHQNYAERIVQ
jgi:dTDP-glucose 4,6-dehydratase